MLDKVVRGRLPCQDSARHLSSPMNIDTRIKFRYLVCFLEIARQRSFTKAADALAVSQPAISKTLEEILAASLFERGKGPDGCR